MSVFNDVDIRVPTERQYGVTTGIVKENYDKDHPGMVKVEYMLGETGKNVTSWIPVMSPYALSDAGIYFLPEIEAEVVITFIMGNRNRPVVIGSLWNNKNKLPEQTVDEKNYVKRVRTKAGHDIIFKEEKDKESIEVHTPKEMKIRIDDEKDTVVIEDKEAKNGIEMKMKDGEIRIFCEKKMTLEVGKKAMITMDGKTVEIKGDDIKEDAAKSVDMKGQTVKMKGGQTSIEGTSSLDVKSSGMTNVKGSMVKIN